MKPHKSELRPLPMRISQLQFERLQSARGRDGLAVQEHVRRALDFYLAKIERDADRARPQLDDSGDSPVAAAVASIQAQPPTPLASPLPPRKPRPRKYLRVRQR